MRKVIYSMGVSLDGFVAGPDGRFGWAAPDEEVHRFHNEQARAVGVNLYGRRMYETMRAWETADAEPSIPDYALEWAQIWKATPRLVFSRTLERAEGGAELAGGDLAETVARLKAQPGGDIAVGGADLAAGFIALGLVDEFRPLVYPVVVGGGTPFFPAVAEPIRLRLAETRTFRSQVVYLRYERASPPIGQ
jgi:dihydrofolate reductase